MGAEAPITALIQQLDATIQEVAQYAPGFVPKVGIILGSGL
jgi:hypothetical protein